MRWARQDAGIGAHVHRGVGGGGELWVSVSFFCFSYRYPLVGGTRGRRPTRHMTVEAVSMVTLRMAVLAVLWTTALAEC